MCWCKDMMTHEKKVLKCCAGSNMDHHWPLLQLLQCNMQYSICSIFICPVSLTWAATGPKYQVSSMQAASCIPDNIQDRSSIIVLNVSFNFILQCQSLAEFSVLKLQSFQIEFLDVVDGSELERLKYNFLGWRLRPSRLRLRLSLRHFFPVFLQWNLLLISHN